MRFGRSGLDDPDGDDGVVRGTAGRRGRVGGSKGVASLTELGGGETDGVRGGGGEVKAVRRRGGRGGGFGSRRSAELRRRKRGGDGGVGTSGLIVDGRGGRRVSDGEVVGEGGSARVKALESRGGGELTFPPIVEWGRSSMLGEQNLSVLSTDPFRRGCIGWGSICERGSRNVQRRVENKGSRLNLEREEIDIAHLLERD